MKFNFRDIEINLSPFLAKLILRFNPFHRVLVMCKGYNEDYENFTELVWDDDKDLDFYDQESYPEFQLWLWPTYSSPEDMNYALDLIKQSYKSIL